MCVNWEKKKKTRRRRWRHRKKIRMFSTFWGCARELASKRGATQRGQKKTFIFPFEQNKREAMGSLSSSSSSLTWCSFDVFLLLIRSPFNNVDISLPIRAHNVALLWCECQLIRVRWARVIEANPLHTHSQDEHETSNLLWSSETTVWRWYVWNFSFVRVWNDSRRFNTTNDCFSAS